MTAEHASVSPGRAERPLVIALDIGSSSVRAGLHDRTGRAIKGCAVQFPYSWEAAPGGSVRMDAQTLLDRVADALDALVRTAAPLSAEVVAGGISCFFHSIVGLDGSGRPVTPLLSWADTTSAGEAAVLRERLDPDAIHAVTGVPLHAGFWPPRVMRLRQERPAIRSWAGFPELVARSLTGRTVLSRSIASGTGLLDRAKGTWSMPLLEQLAIEPDDLSELVADDEALGRLSADASRRWPQLAGAVWFPAWGDGACGNVGLSATGPTRAALMAGTSGALRAIVTDPAPPIPDGLFAYRLGPGSVVGGQLSEGGGLLAWLGSLLGRSRASLERAAAQMEPDAHGLTVLPYTFGERGLGYHDDARGSWVGLHPGTTAAEIYRATLEAIAFGFAEVDDQLSQTLGGRPAIIAAGGGLTRLLSQIIADSVERELIVASAVEASQRGAALLALRGSGHLGDVEELPPVPGRKVVTDPARSARYATARVRQRALYKAILG